MCVWCGPQLMATTLVFSEFIEALARVAEAKWGGAHSDGLHVRTRTSYPPPTPTPSPTHSLTHTHSTPELTPLLHLPPQQEFAYLLDAMAVWDHFRAQPAQQPVSDMDGSGGGRSGNGGSDGGVATTNDNGARLPSIGEGNAGGGDKSTPPGVPRKGASKGAMAVLHRVAELMTSHRVLV